MTFKETWSSNYGMIFVKKIIGLLFHFLLEK